MVMIPDGLNNKAKLRKALAGMPGVPYLEEITRQPLSKFLQVMPGYEKRYVDRLWRRRNDCFFVKQGVADMIVEFDGDVIIAYDNFLQHDPIVTNLHDFKKDLHQLYYYHRKTSWRDRS